MSMSCKSFPRLLAWPAAALLWGGLAGAQQPEPAPLPARASPAQPKAESTAQSEAGEPRATTEVARPATPALQGPATPSRAPAAGSKAPGAADRLKLNTATVTGDREQPKVMYIVPWKRADIGDLSGKPMNSLLDEALAPVDRDEFKREVAYYDAMQAAPHNGASTPAAQGEK